MGIASLGLTLGQVEQESIVRKLYVKRQLPFLQQQSKNEMRVERLSCLPTLRRTGARAARRARKSDIGTRTLG